MIGIYGQAGTTESTPPPGGQPGHHISRVLSWCIRRWWLIVPLAVLPVAWVARLVARLLAHARDIGAASRADQPHPQVSPERAADLRDDATRRADGEIEQIRRQADDARRMLRERYGSGRRDDGR